MQSKSMIAGLNELMIHKWANGADSTHHTHTLLFALMRRTA